MTLEALWFELQLHIQLIWNLLVFTEVLWAELKFTSLNAVLLYERSVELNAEELFFRKHVS